VLVQTDWILPRDIDGALEIRTILDHHPGGAHIANQSGRTPDLNLVARFDLTLNVPEYDDLPGLDAGLYRAVGANGEPMFFQLDRAFYITVDRKVFPAHDLTFDADRLT
jgi:hypothetical protein